MQSLMQYPMQSAMETPTPLPPTPLPPDNLAGGHIIVTVLPGLEVVP